MEFVIIFLIVIALDIAALRWGSDSRDTIESAEWQRRNQWLLHVPAHHS